MKLLWDNYYSATGRTDIYAHCDEKLDDHGKYSVICLKKLEEYINGIPLLESITKKDIVLDLLEELTYFHDLGKADQEFQENLSRACNNKNNIKLPQHSEKGFLKIVSFLLEREKNYEKETFGLSLLLSTIIARHHSDLVDIENYKNIYQPEISEYYKMILSSIKKAKIKYELYFLYRLFYSCLKTSDMLATSFGNQIESINVEETMITPAKIIKYKEKLKEHIEKLDRDKEICNYREKFRQMAINRVNTSLVKHPEKRIFFLYLPTGGGKTLTSLSVALELAEKKNLKRIFYVFPYINIIEQNSLVLKKIFDEDLKAIHTYSEATEINADQDNESADYKHSLNIETFNFPAVAMSSVRFFDILFSNKKSAVLKTWALANSVIILDEVQYFPKRYWEAIIKVLTEFGKLFNTYFILMSATLPRLDMFLKEKDMVTDIIAKSEIKEESKYFEKRVKIETLKAQKDEKDAIVEKAIELVDANQKVLVVMNTIKGSIYVYQKLEEKLGKNIQINLLNSTLLYPRRLEILETLSKKDNEKKILVSTQSIEAGVDLDFNVGIRERAPPESIVQIMGRINRESINETSILYVTEKSSTMDRIYRECKDLGIHFHPSELNDSDTIDKYFEKIIPKLRVDLKYGSVSTKILEDIKMLNFEKVGHNKLIENKAIDLFFKGKVRIKNEYIIGENKYDTGKKIKEILDTLGFSESYERNDNKITLDTYKFSEYYNTYFAQLSKSSYEERFSQLTNIKRLNYIWRMFTFSLYFQKINGPKIIEIDNHGKRWIGDNDYSFEKGFVMKEPQISDYIW